MRERGRKAGSKKAPGNLVEEKVEVRLLDGGRLQGRLKEMNKHELVLERQGCSMVVFKHAVAYIAPLKGFMGALMEEGLP